MCGVRKEGGLSGGWFGESRVVTAGRESVPGCSRQVMPADRLDVQGWTNEGLPEGNVSDERVLEKSESLIQREKSCVGEDHGESFGRLL